MDFSSEGRLRFSALRLGDASGGVNATAAIVELSNGAMLVSSADDPAARISSPDGKTLVVSSVCFSLRLRQVLDGSSTMVQVEVVPWTS